MKRILILLADGVMDTSIALTLDALKTVNLLSKNAPYQWTLFNPKASNIVTGAGAIFHVKSDVNISEYDALLIPGFGWESKEQIISQLQNDMFRQLVTWLTLNASSFDLVTASCSGVFLLAESGFLNDRSATTSWWLAPFFRQRYPHVTLDETIMVVNDKNSICAGAATAQLDLVLMIIYRFSGAAIAKSVSHFLATEARTSQAKFISRATLSSLDGDIIEIDRWLRNNFSKEISLQSIASGLAMSTRTLDRRVRKSLGISPIKLLQRIRIERAIHLIETTNQPLQKIASQVGYQNTSTLRRLLKRELHQNPSDLRKYKT